MSSTRLRLHAVEIPESDSSSDEELITTTDQESSEDEHILAKPNPFRKQNTVSVDTEEVIARVMDDNQDDTALSKVFRDVIENEMRNGRYVSKTLRDPCVINEKCYEVPKHLRETGGTPENPGPIGKMELIAVICKRIEDLDQNIACHCLGDLSKYKFPQNTTSKFIHIAIQEIKEGVLNYEIRRKLPRNSRDIVNGEVVYDVEIFHIKELYISPKMLDGFLKQ